MDLYEVFSSPFKLCEANGYSHPCTCLKVKFKTEDIEEQRKKYLFYPKYILMI